jgi:hypothetical protein
MNGKLERIWKAAVVTYQGIFLEGLRKTTNILIQDTLYRSRDSNLAPISSKSRALLLHQPARCNICTYFCTYFYFMKQFISEWILER